MIVVYFLQLKRAILIYLMGIFSQLSHWYWSPF